MAKDEVAISEIDFDFTTSRNEISAEEQSDLLSSVLRRKWILVVAAETDLSGPLCQQISTETGCLVRDVTFTSQVVG